ncbi:hypothetical protein CYLTODRAFT_418935 [Cylindrobasidium torrendii FP15055 ss-10]|uniref:EKC/KEOPS complex subunit GON7 n=1 Tax=Cylindrobasidium torrendii FP15055 ss-10 TaxID=1314674 RepID=A0A0D7BLG7_9AGAR|nr:hypothetical protein CYLTODRAFT_418935 [Cylindrobasidium torrendii FP15055 ss-10]
MSAQVIVSYDLNPPESIDTDLHESKSASFSVSIAKQKGAADNNADAAGGQRAYYAALRNTIHMAKAQLGEELTAWRDAVGDAEKALEAKAGKTQDADDAEDNEDEEDE